MQLKKKYDAGIFAVLSILIFESVAYGSQNIPDFINYYQMIAEKFGFPQESISILASLFTFLLCLIVGLCFRRAIERSSDEVPSSQVSLRNFVEMVMDLIYSLSKEHCGLHYRNFLPLMSGLFIFILISNLSGLVPGLPPATEDFNMNLAMGIIVFFCYHYAGLKEHGGAYIKQFTGPFLLLAPLFLMIEMISHGVRPLSLAFRLLANIFCDHLLLGVFSGLIPLLVPTLFLFFGLLVAIIQSFVFTLLTGIYINMAVSHDH